MRNIYILCSVIILINCVTSVSASSQWQRQTGKWSEPNKWTGDGIPAGNSEVVIRYSGSLCTVDADTGDWDIGQRLRVYEDANMVIADGAKMFGFSWMRVGTGDGQGHVIQTGGTIQLKSGRDDTKLAIGYEDGSQGSSYTISGGTISYLDGGGYLILGYKEGHGKLTIVGTEPEIKMGRLYVGGDNGERLGTGILEYKISAQGVSPVKISGKVYIDRQPEATTTLAVSTLAEPPQKDIVLVENTGYGEIDGVFDSLIDATGTKAAEEGAAIVLKYEDKESHYKLTYRYDAAKDGGANDIALISVPAPPDG
jgi:hypothetical protein